MFNKLYKWIQWLLVFGVTLAVLVIIAYFSTFHDGLSDSSSDWADFGSLLAGVFTFCGALATIATLLAIHKENEENRNIIQQQSEALTFEQYLKHRELFIKILSDTASDCPRNIELYNLDDLYKTIFPNNKPTNRPRYLVELKSGEECQPGDLSDIVESYKLLEAQLESNNPDCAFHLVKMMGMLRISSTEEPANGDLIFAGENTGINIYSLKNKVYEIYRLLNTLLYFTGNDDLENITHHAGSGILRFSLIKNFLDKRSLKDEFYATKVDPKLEVLEEIYIGFYENHYFKDLFKGTARRIEKGFSGRDEVESLLSDANGFLSCYIDEYRQACNNNVHHSKQGKVCIEEAYKSIEKLRTIYLLGNLKKE